MASKPITPTIYILILYMSCMMDLYNTFVRIGDESNEQV